MNEGIFLGVGQTNVMARKARFSPGVINYDGPISAAYGRGRALSLESCKVWCAAVAPFVQTLQPPRILDLGAGTGRFAALFAQSFEQQVIAVEPSLGMLAAALAEERRANLAYVAGTAESIPLRNGSCGLAWLSHVWHHVRDRHACAQELRRVLGRGKTVLVRGTFGDKVDGFPTLFRYWPGTRTICQQLPTTRETVAVFEATGFAQIEHRQVEQPTCDSLREFAVRTKLRADSALALISDAEFRLGQSAIEQAALYERAPSPVIEVIELLRFESV
jgi:SAM-dependent methyltransferase